MKEEIQPVKMKLLQQKRLLQQQIKELEMKIWEETHKKVK